MKYLALRLIVALSTFLVGLSVTALMAPLRFDTVARGEAEQEILQVERQYIQAHLDRDTATLDNILADEFTIGPTRGSGMNKFQRLALLENPNYGFEAISTRDVQVKVNGERAVVTGIAMIEGHNGDREFSGPPFKFIRDYEKRQGRWQIVAVRVRR